MQPDPQRADRLEAEFAEAVEFVAAFVADELEPGGSRLGGGDGLFTPVLRDADKKSLSALSSEMKDLAARARTRKLAPQEYQGGSFAISNLGMMGIENFDAVINPPHAAILAVGAGIKTPVVLKDGTVGVANVMSMTLSVDHRVIDGALGAELLKAIIENLENPMAMLA